jgi:CRISPR-associated endonuclease Cas3-HD
MGTNMKSIEHLANSTGQPLELHARLVGWVARFMGVRCGLDSQSALRIPPAFCIGDILEVLGWGHDLGKVPEHFQKALGNVEDTTEETSDSDRPFHHEISWAYLANRFDATGHNKWLLNAIYWHHARPVAPNGDFFQTKDAILAKLTPKEIGAIDAFASRFDWSKGFRVDSPPCGDMDVPELFAPDGGGNNDENAGLHILRSLLIAADRFVSSLTPEEFDACAANQNLAAALVEQACPVADFGNPKAPEGYDTGRFQRQIEIARLATASKTVSIRAPAGFGKTMLGILWTAALRQPVIWVAPRNIVAEAVYLNACKELDALGLKASIELYLTGERQAVRGDAPEFGSEIIVTNIDSVLNPMVENRTAGRLFRILGSAMIFDEFHELVGDSPLFAAFVTLMRARHRICGSEIKTLLLSATPNAASCAWDTEGNETVHLPGPSSHYPPAHSGKYRVYWEDAAEPTPERNGRLAIFNAVARSQEAFATGEYASLAHSKFTPADRRGIFEAILRDFGKGGSGVAEGKNVVAALVIQAAMDVSFLHLDERICSPDFTLQRIGRIDRWGHFQNLSPSIRLGIDTSRNDQSATRMLYNPALREKWIATLREAFPAPRSVGLDELYEIYNAFHAAHRAEIRDYILTGYKDGIDTLRDYGPVKPRNPSPEPGEDESTRGRSKRSLRNPMASWFFTVRRKAEGAWLGPEELMDEGIELRARFDKGPHEKGLLDSSRMLKFLKDLHVAGFPRFRRYLKGKRAFPDSTKKWFTLARNPDTPLPDFTRTYDPQYGLQDEQP